MGRTKVKMELITNDKNRKMTYRNRKNGLIKKAKELSTLCDVNCAIIIYPPPDHSSDNPEIWPENADQIKKTIASYKDKKNANGKKVMCDVKDYLQAWKRKVEDELVKTREKNMEAIYPTKWFDDLKGLSEDQLRQFTNRMEQKECILKARLELLNETRHDHVQTLDDDDIMSVVNRWFDDPENEKIALECKLENNQLEPSNHCVGSESGLSFDQVQSTLNHDSMIGHDFGCLKCAQTTSFTPQKPDEMGIRFDYPALEDDEQVYDNSKQLCSMPKELALQEDSHVNDDSFENFVIDGDIPEIFSILGFDDSNQEDLHVDDGGVEYDDLQEILMALD